MLSEQEEGGKSKSTLLQDNFQSRASKEVRVLGGQGRGLPLYLRDYRVTTFYLLPPSTWSKSLDSVASGMARDMPGFLGQSAEGPGSEHPLPLQEWDQITAAGALGALRQQQKMV